MVADIVEEFDKFLLKRLLNLFGKSVQVTSMILKNSGYTFLIPLYRFGTNDGSSLPIDTALLFLLQPYNKTNGYRLYLKGCSTAFAQKPLSPEEMSVINEFETLFTSHLAFLGGSLVLKIVRNADSLISATFREVKRFIPRKPSLKVNQVKKGKPKPKPKFKKIL